MGGGAYLNAVLSCTTADYRRVCSGPRTQGDTAGSSLIGYVGHRSEAL